MRTAKRKPKKNLLIVDDQVMLLDVMERQFEGDPDIELAGSAAEASEALRFVREKRPDIVMLDVDLGGGDSGFDVLQALRALPGGGPRIVMVSMFENPMYRNRAFNLGADAYVTKGVRFRTMRSVLLDDRSYEVPEGDRGKFWRNSPEAVARPGSDPFQSLSERENAIVREVVRGLSEKEIASDLGVTVSTVSTYLRRAMAKLGVSTRAELLRQRHALE